MENQMKEKEKEKEDESEESRDGMPLTAMGTELGCSF